MIPFEILLEKYIQDQLKPDELKLFLQAVKDSSNAEELAIAINKKLHQQNFEAVNGSFNLPYLFKQVIQKEELEPQSVAAPAKLVTLKKLAVFSMVKYAAAVLVLLAGCILFWLTYTPAAHNTAQIKVVRKPLKNEGLPGGNKATLTLADGSTINLNDAQDGVVARQGNTKIVKLVNGQLLYTAGKTIQQNLYNTMTTPRGGQYNLTLPDGTQVWLNAASSITYPTAFTGQERIVQMVGEAYFEVAHNAKQPFKVKVKNMEVTVLGTHFNINACEGETATKTTLLQGSVKIIKGNTTTLLKPGQQAASSNYNEGSSVEEVDVTESVAWKNGLFCFNDAGLGTIMRQLANWYDLDIHYEGQLPQRHFTGKVFRNLNLSEILKFLALNHINCKIEGNQLTLLP